MQESRRDEAKGCEANDGVQWADFGGYIKKADGTIIEMGEIAYYHKNPLKVLWWRIKTRKRRKAAYEAARRACAKTREEG